MWKALLEEERERVNERASQWRHTLKLPLLVDSALAVPSRAGSRLKPRASQDVPHACRDPGAIQHCFSRCFRSIHRMPVLQVAAYPIMSSSLASSWTFAVFCWFILVIAVWMGVRYADSSGSGLRFSQTDLVVLWGSPWPEGVKHGRPTGKCSH